MVLLLASASGMADLRTRMSLGLAYAATVALAVTLCLGTVNLIRCRPNPVSSDLRRDIGIWTALLAIGHTAIGLTVHFRGQMHLYFLSPPDQRLPGPLRLDLFGLANDLGAVAVVVFVGLAAISSDAALARLGTVRWKRWQRSAYIAAALTAAHGISYQLLDERQAGLVALVVSLGVLILAAQYYGIRLTRRH